jgi:hypothetical protein
MTNHPFKHEIIWVKVEAPPEQDISSLLEQDLASLLDPVEFVVDPALLSISRLIRDAYSSTTNSYFVAGVSGRCFSTRICYRVLHHRAPLRQSHHIVTANGEWSEHDLNQTLLGEGPSKNGGDSAGLTDCLVFLLPLSNFNAFPSYKNWNGVIERAFRLCLTNAAPHSEEQQVHRQRTPDSRLRCALTIEQFWAILKPRHPSL